MHCIGYDLGGKGRLGKRFVWICAGRRKHGQIKQNFSRLLFHPLSNTQLNTDICNSARAQLKNKCEAAFDTSFHTRSHYPLTRAFCQFSHSRARRETLTRFHRERYSKGVFDAAPVCARPVFPLCKRNKSVTSFPRKRSLLGFLVCVQLTPLSCVIANNAHKVTILVCCAAPASNTHHVYRHCEGSSLK